MAVKIFVPIFLTFPNFWAYFAKKILWGIISFQNIYRTTYRKDGEQSFILYSAFVSPISRKPTGSSIISTPTIPNSTRRWDPWIQPRWRRSQSASQLWLSGFSTTAYSWNSNKTGFLRYKAGSIQAGPVSSLVIGCDVAVKEASKSLVFIMIQHYPWTIKWRHQSRHAITTSALSDTSAEAWHSNLSWSWSPSVSSRRVSRLLQLAAVYGTSKSNLNKLQRVQSDLVPVVLQLSSLELQLGVLAQTASLAPGSAKDHFQEDTHHIQREIPQPSYLHSLLDNYTPSRNLRSEGQHLLRIPLRRSAAARRSFCMFRRANNLEQSQSENSRSQLTRVIQDARLKAELFSSAFQWSILFILSLPPCCPSIVLNVLGVLAMIPSQSASCDLRFIFDFGIRQSNWHDEITRAVWSNQL